MKENTLTWEKGLNVRNLDDFMPGETIKYVIDIIAPFYPEGVLYYAGGFHKSPEESFVLVTRDIDAARIYNNKNDAEMAASCLSGLQHQNGLREDLYRIVTLEFL